MMKYYCQHCLKTLPCPTTDDGSIIPRKYCPDCSEKSSELYFDWAESGSLEFIKFKRKTERNIKKMKERGIDIKVPFEEPETTTETEPEIDPLKIEMNAIIGMISDYKDLECPRHRELATCSRDDLYRLIMMISDYCMRKAGRK